jgi:hypothetical protein
MDGIKDFFGDLSLGGLLGTIIVVLAIRTN